MKWCESCAAEERKMRDLEDSLRTTKERLLSACVELDALRLARRDLGEILAVIHRDGGHHTGEHGVSQSVADAHATWAAVVLERDKVIEERDRARQACNAYWHDLERIASLCKRTADEYPLKAVVYWDMCADMNRPLKEEE